MFFGTTPSIVSQYIFSEILAHKPKRVFVPFSGNFVVEQLAAKAGVTEIHCTDVSLYSRAIGFGVTGQDSDIKIKKEYLKLYPSFKKLDSPLDTAAMMIFFTEVAKYHEKKAAYYQQLVKDSISNQVAYLDKIKTKLKAIQETCGHMTFYGVDACEIIGQVEKGDLVFYDPPVLLGDYEKMFAAVEKYFDYVEPEYTQMTEEVKNGQLEKMAKDGAIVYYRTNNRTDSLPKKFKHVFFFNYKTGGDYCIYANKHINTFVGRRSALTDEIRHLPLIDKEQEITTKTEIRIEKLKGNVGNHFRMMWVKKANMSNGGTCYGVFADSKLIGLLQLENGVKLNSELVSIFSDPACPYSKYKRLSKLIIMICCTKDVLNMVNDSSMWTHVGFTTRVYTNNPVSMKYRDMFKLSSRDEDDSSNYKYKLIYQNRNKIFNSIQDALDEWLSKHGKHTLPL